MDIRELRIGNSVLFGDKRVKVEGVVIQNGIVFFENDNAYVDMLDPIPITEELLKELGFEEEKPQGEGWDYGIEKVFMKEFDSPIEEDYFISMAQYEEGLYQLRVLGTLVYVRNLHELESYLYMTTKKELI